MHEKHCSAFISSLSCPIVGADLLHDSEWRSCLCQVRGSFGYRLRGDCLVKQWSKRFHTSNIGSDPTENEGR